MMARPKKETQRVSIGASILPAIDKAIIDISVREGRTKSQVIEKLLQRGLAAYLRDGSLFELEGQQVIKIAEIGEDTQYPTLSRKTAKTRKK